MSALLRNISRSNNRSLTQSIESYGKHCSVSLYKCNNSTKTAVNANHTEEDGKAKTKFDRAYLEHIVKTGQVPKKFNFARDIFDLHAVSKIHTY